MNRRMPIAKTYYHNLLMYRQTNVTQIPLILTCVSCKLLGRIYFTLGLKYKLHYLYWINNLISIKNIDKKNTWECQTSIGMVFRVGQWRIVGYWHMAWLSLSLPDHATIRVLQPLIHRLATPTCINNWLYCESSQVAPHLIYK